MILEALSNWMVKPWPSSQRRWWCLHEYSRATINKGPETGWVLDVRSLWLRHQQNHAAPDSPWEGSIKVSHSGFGGSLVCGSIWYCHLWDVCVCVCVCVCVWPNITFLKGYAFYWNSDPSYSSMTWCLLITSAKTLFPNKTIFWGTGG
jgi:hypothetical protein